MAASLALIIILGLSADYLFRKMRIPGLVGMLLVGILCGPYGLDLIAPEMMKVSGDFRRIALIIILLRAGFELHKDTLHRVGRDAVLVSIIPALLEIAGVMLAGPRLLGLGLLESAILGAILAAVSPAVVVPLMIDFMDRGLGVKKGIPTLLLAASSLNDVFVIIVFTMLVGMYGGDANVWIKVAELPVSIALGILIGLVPGYLLYKLFTRYDWRPPKRTLAVLGTAIVLTQIEISLERWVPVASLLGVMAIGFIILEKSEPIAHIISQKLKKLWIFAELLLFVLVGAQVDIHVARQAGLAGAAVIAAGLLFRSAGTYLSLLRSGLNPKEKLFSVVAYSPKATVQAAIGAVPLAAGVASGEIILAVAVLSILLTVPLGAGIIRAVAERWLERGEAMSLYRFKELREKLGLPRVGERLRSKQHGTVWKVIEKKEIWLHGDSSSSGSGEAGRVPAIYLRYWREETSKGPGRGKTMAFEYSIRDRSFDKHWEILYDW
ncbi:MAG: cation:proton antiporter [Syntrophobacteraceae bacterium]